MNLHEFIASFFLVYRGLTISKCPENDPDLA